MGVTRGCSHFRLVHGDSLLVAWADSAKAGFGVNAALSYQTFPKMNTDGITINNLLGFVSCDDSEYADVLHVLRNLFQ